MPRHATSLGSSSFATSSKILQKYEQDRMYQIHKQKLADSKHMLNNSRPGTYPHLILRLKQIQKEEERQAEVDHDNKILLNRMTKILKYGGQVDNWNDYESRSLNYPYRERQTQKIARENRGIAHRLEKVRPVYQRKKWDSEYKQHEYRRRMLAESTKDYTKLTPRRYNNRISKARSLDTGLSQLYEDDFESDHEEDVKTKLPKLKDKQQSTNSKDSVKNETKPVKLPQIQQSQNQMKQDENQKMKRKKSKKTIGIQTSLSDSSGDNSDYGDEELQSGQLRNQPIQTAYLNDRSVESNTGLKNVQTLVNNMADDEIEQNYDNDYGEETYGHIDENEVEVSEKEHHQMVKNPSGIANKLSNENDSQFTET
ncbi:hypothetical protein ACJMK2_037267 [Sinanodonta woodiana]|uniref:Uncharacterized protein n=1 Tax=Sinanodonta woodiana TaxID=1069815 RepID=A0ABD3WNA8_SINWO